jgi:hypothetical protein
VRKTRLSADVKPARRADRHSNRARGERGEIVRDSNPDTPPDSHDPAGRCPRCGRPSSFEVIGSLPITIDRSSYTQDAYDQIEHDPIDRVSSLMRRACNQAVAVIEEEWIGDFPRRVSVVST